MTEFLSPHFTMDEAFPPKCNRENLAVPFDQAKENARVLAVQVLEPVREALNSPLGVNSWARDRAFNASLATDPASAARVLSRPGPHTDGSAADVRIIKADKLPEDQRNAAYLGAFKTIYNLAYGPAAILVNEAILEYAKDNKHITHIHLQARLYGPKRRFVTRKWKTNAEGVLVESYEAWKP